ncbi:MAG: hypothetical protein K0Q95_2457 [Bacteroidota bacterium]|jgi:hypothetical protein|nr:hypothetical protein [Bacteroidota bacterium]
MEFLLGQPFIFPSNLGYHNFFRNFNWSVSFFSDYVIESNKGNNALAMLKISFELYAANF